ncbi:MAG: hypothetical protein R3Y65_00675 [Bacillota bacterium]
MNSHDNILFSRYNSWDEIGGFLFGNGISIGLTNASYFGNAKIMDVFNRMLNADEKRLIADIIEFMDWYLFEYFDDNIREGFFNQVSKYYLDQKTADKIRCIEVTQNLINLHIEMFNASKKQGKKYLLDYSIEQLQIFENIYYNFIKNDSSDNVEKYTLINNDWVYKCLINYADYFKKAIKIIQEDSVISRKLLVNQFGSKKIFTTNYDTLLDGELQNVVHLHGSIDGNIITGSEYFIKALQLSATEKYQTKYDIVYNDKIQELLKVRGTLCIVGYSCYYNDEHIHQVIRANKSINKIVYFEINSKYDELTQDITRQNYLCKCLGIDGANRRLYIENADIFYYKYICAI